MNSNKKHDQKAWIQGIHNQVNARGMICIPALKKGGMDFFNFQLYLSEFAVKRLPDGKIMIAKHHVAS